MRRRCGWRGESRASRRSARRTSCARRTGGDDRQPRREEARAKSEDKLSDKEFEQALLLRKLVLEVRDLESRWRASGRAMKAMLQAIAVLGGIYAALAADLFGGDAADHRTAIDETPSALTEAP